MNTLGSNLLNLGDMVQGGIWIVLSMSICVSIDKKERWNVKKLTD